MAITATERVKIDADLKRYYEVLKGLGLDPEEAAILILRRKSDMEKKAAQGVKPWVDVLRKELPELVKKLRAAGCGEVLALQVNASGEAKRDFEICRGPDKGTTRSWRFGTMSPESKKRKPKVERMKEVLGI